MIHDVKTRDEIRVQIARILGSRTFCRADTLRRLLDYLAEKSLTGEAAELKEYSIGVDVFGKPPSYDPQKDASVRIQAAKLRQKLEEYYRSEGLNDPIVVEFPKGHFILQFTRRPPQQQVPVRRQHPSAWLVSALAGFCLSGFIALLLFHSFRSTRLSEEQRAIWGPLIGDRRPVLLCVGTPLFIKDSRGFYRSPRVNQWEEAADSPDFTWLRPQILSGSAIPVQIYTGVGDAMAAVEVARLLTSTGTRFIFRRSSVISWEELSSSNIVFVGPPKYTPRLNEIPAQMDFVMEGRRILNLRPRTGEPAYLEGNWPDHSPYVVDDYALISRLPGVHGRSRYLILSASSTEGTAAAALFVTDPKLSAEFVKQASGGTGRLPEFFQVVIHARFREMVPVGVKYKFHHELRLEQPK
ncbi:MAG: hypothetical protein ACUVXB_15985 [Bryobacteraceae bacterium]